MVRLGAAAALAIWFAPLVVAQTPLVIQTESREVLLDVTVTDKQGIPVPGLAAKDFSVSEDGRVQKISGFSVTSADPAASRKHFILYLDFSALDLIQQREMVEHAREFVSAMADNDRFMAVVTMSRGGSSVQQNFTTLVSSLNKGLDASLAMAATPPVAGLDYQLSTTAGGMDASQSARSPAQRLAESLSGVARSVAPESGRKVVLLFTGGDWLDARGRDAIDQAIVECNRANMAIYAVAGSPPRAQINVPYRRDSVVPLTSPGEEIQMLASGTGGGVVTISSANLAQELGAIAREQDESYRIGYVPPQSKEGSCHTIRVKADIPGDVKARGEYCTAKAVDIVAGKIAGRSVEARAAVGTPGNASMQTPWFYTGANRASVHLSLDLTPAGTKFHREGGKLHGQIELVGTASRGDGATAARFADSVPIDLDNQKQADNFIKGSWHYENQFPIVTGKLSFALLISAGDSAPVRLSAPLDVDAWNGSQFAIGGIALSKQIFDADSGAAVQDGPILEGRTPLVAGGKRFVPASNSRFRRSGPAYFYTEIYEPLLAGAAPPSLKMEYRIVDRTAGVVKEDTGMAGIGGFVQAGNPVVSVGTTLRIGALPPGDYRLEVLVAHSSGPEVVARSVDFELE